MASKALILPGHMYDDAWKTFSKSSADRDLSLTARKYLVRVMLTSDSRYTQKRLDSVLEP